jgi:hypothetical protein
MAAKKRVHKRKESIPRPRPGRKSDAKRWPRARDKVRDKTFSATAKGVGRGKVYEPDFADRARKLCATHPLTDWDLAVVFGVSRRTIINWRAEYPEFAEACQSGKDVYDDAVERALGARALGYEHQVEKIFCHKGKVTRVETIEQLHPDPSAAYVWLKNRRGGKWKDRHEHTGADGGPIQVIIGDPTRRPAEQEPLPDPAADPQS